MNELALFAGAGGGILGGKLLGWRTVCAVEWESYPASVLVARQNDRRLVAEPGFAQPVLRRRLGRGWPVRHEVDRRVQRRHVARAVARPGGAVRRSRGIGRRRGG